MATPAGGYAQPPPAPSGGTDPMMLALIQLLLGEQASKRQESLDERLIRLREKESAANLGLTGDVYRGQQATYFDMLAKDVVDQEMGPVAREQTRVFGDPKTGASGKLSESLKKVIDSGERKASSVIRKMERLSRETARESDVVSFLKMLPNEIRSVAEKAENPLELSAYLTRLEAGLVGLGNAHSNNKKIMAIGGPFDTLMDLTGDFFEANSGRNAEIGNRVFREAALRSTALSDELRGRIQARRDEYRVNVANEELKPQTAYDQLLRFARSEIKGFSLPSEGQWLDELLVTPGFGEKDLELPATPPEEASSVTSSIVDRELAKKLEHAESLGGRVESARESFGKAAAEIEVGTGGRAIGHTGMGLLKGLGVLATEAARTAPPVLPHGMVSLGPLLRGDMYFGEEGRPEPTIINLVSEEEGFLDLHSQEQTERLRQASEEERQKRLLEKVLFAPGTPLGESVYGF